MSEAKDLRVDPSKNLDQRFATEEEVRRLSNFRESIIRTAGEGICVCTPKEVHPHIEFSVWNDRMIEITGYTMDEINQTGWYQTLYPDPEYQKKAMLRMQRMRDGFDLRNEEWTITRKDKTERTVTISTSVVEIESGVPAVVALMQDVTEQHQVRKRLQESEERLQLAIDASKLAPWDWDLRTNEVFLSREWKQQLGFDNDELEGTYEDWVSRLHPNDRSEVLRELQSYLRGEIPDYEIEFRMRHKDGTFRWIYTRGAVHHDESGTPIRMLGCHLDITQRKATEETLRHILESVSSMTGQEYFSSLVKFLYDTCDVDLVLVAARSVHDPGRARTLAVFQEGEIRENFDYRLEGSPCANVLERNNTAVCHYQNALVEFPDDAMLHDRGLDHYLAIPLWSSVGEPIGLIALLSRNPVDSPDRATQLLQVVGARSGAEIERHRAEAAVRASESRLASIAATLPHTLYVFNVRTHETEYQNRFLASNLGYSESELNAMQPGILGKLLHPEDRERLPELLARWDTAEDGEVFETEYRMLHRSGEWRWYLGRDTVYQRDPDGSVRTIIGTSQDITHRVRAESERRELEAQIQHGQKLESLGVLAGGIAHDFNNLLTSILGFADLATMSLPADSNAASYINEVINGAQSAAELTGQMLAYSGKGKFTTEPVNLSKVVSETSRLLDVSVSKRHSLHLDLDQELPLLEGDTSQLQQVIMNLIINASEAIGDEEGSIKVKTETTTLEQGSPLRQLLPETTPTGRYICLAVTDTGCGMDEATKVKLFDPFFTTKFSGRGLGMSAVLGIVRGHQGAIAVESSPGTGSSFYVLFPETEKSSDHGLKREGESSDRKRKGTVLVADDEATILHSTSVLLKSLGYQVVTCSNGREAVEQFESMPDEICLVLLDLTMPQLDGNQACIEIRKTRSDVPVILMSGYSEESAGRELTTNDWIAFLQKPYRIEQLKQALNEVEQPKQDPAESSISIE